MQACICKNRKYGEWSESDLCHRAGGAIRIECSGRGGWDEKINEILEHAIEL